MVREVGEAAPGTETDEVEPNAAPAETQPIPGDDTPKAATETPAPSDEAAAPAEPATETPITVIEIEEIARQEPAVVEEIDTEEPAIVEEPSETPLPPIAEIIATEQTDSSLDDAGATPAVAATDGGAGGDGDGGSAAQAESWTRAAFMPGGLILLVALAGMLAGRLAEHRLRRRRATVVDPGYPVATPLATTSGAADHVISTPLRGCIPILCTPFTADNAVDLGSLAREVEWVLAEGAAGLAALAIAGEGYKLTEPERDAVTRQVVATVAGRVPVVVSADGAGTDVAVERAVQAAALGADALMVLPPYFVKPDGPGLVDYYTRVGRAVTIPVIVQDAPQLTGVAMSPAMWAALARDVESIRFVKAEGTPQGRTLSETLARGEGRLAVFCGWGGLGMIDALERGAAGSMPAPNFTRLFADVQALHAAGDPDGAADRFATELPFVLWAMQSIDFSVAAAKREMHRRGILATPDLRQPAVTLDDVSLRQLDAFIDARMAGPPRNT